LKNLLFKNFGKKALSFIFAVALWFAANIEEDIEKGVLVSINYANLPSDLIITNNPHETLSLRVRGPRGQLATPSIENLSISLDLSQAKPGTSTFDIHTDQINLPRAVTVVGISPSVIEIETDKSREKKAKVKPTVGEPDEGYEILKVKATPSEVNIRGPEKVVSAIDEVPTDRINTTGVKSSFTVQVPLKLNQPKVEVLEENKIVQVGVEIKEKILTKEFKNIGIVTVNFEGFNESDFTLTPQQVDLAFEGPYSIIKDLTGEEIRAYIDGKELKINNHSQQKLKIHVETPYKSLKITKQTPKETKVTVKKKEVEKL